MRSTIKTWVLQNRLDAVIHDNFTFSINGVGKFLIIDEKQDKIFDDNFELILSKEEESILLKDSTIEFFAFQFGRVWYYSESTTIEEFNELRYIGTEVDCFQDREECAPPFLGVHGGYDLCNGSRSYSDWCQKARWCKQDTLGLVEENTLAGTLAFQNACEKFQMKSILGMTVVVKSSYTKQKYRVKLYCTSNEGWKNLLLINTEINVTNEQFVEESKLFSLSKDLICVLNQDVDLSLVCKNYLKASFTRVLFQFDIAEWKNSQRDREVLNNLQIYLSKYINVIDPVFISDAYYLEREHSRIRRDLNKIGKLSFQNQSDDQYYKTPRELLSHTLTMFDDTDRVNELIIKALDNLHLFRNINFKIETDKLHLPHYEMTSEEQDQYSDNVELFWSLIEKGLAEKIVSKGIDPTPYVERIEKESQVILDAKLHDYFLITWDILNWAQSNNIQTGYGRGSAAGCLISYLLGIVKTDPLQYDLIFERFLNEGRLYKTKKIVGWEVTDDDGKVSVWQECPHDADAMGFKVVEKEVEIKVPGSMPDIDNDIQASRREEVKRYIETKYNSQRNRVASIGTYSAFKIKGAIKDLARLSGTDPQFANYITGTIENDSSTYCEFFKASTEIKALKDFIQENPILVEKIQLILNQPKTPSIHAAGIIIVPLSENGIFDQIPVKLVDGALVSEWEDDYIEQAGFLKLDLLGLKQLDKFQDIVSMIKTTDQVDVKIDAIPLDNIDVYDMFAEGRNEDVFQFGGYGLKGYTSELRPETISDLIATVALYRPGPIETGAHMRYVKKKNKAERIIYPKGTEEILKESFGEIIYQESVMRIVSDIAGFTLNEADDVRKAMGKKIPEMMQKYKSKFVEGARRVTNYPTNEAEYLWDQMELFAGYAFNKSHATCYAITGYHSQWLKVNYPLQFWTVSLRHSEDKQIPKRLSEIQSTTTITISPVDINKSTETFECDVELNTIYWTIRSVKQLGDSAVEAIINERITNGKFFSIEEFVKRMKPYSKAVKKNTIINLILAGAFDEIENISNVKQRLDILERYQNFTDLELLKQMSSWKEYRWVLKQNELTGLGSIDLKPLIHKTKLAGKIGKYKSIREILESDVEELGDEILVAGIVCKFDVKTSPKNPTKPFVSIQITDGQMILSGMMWNETFTSHSDLFQTSLIDKLLVLSVNIKFDRIYAKSNVFYTHNKSLLTIIQE